MFKKRFELAKRLSEKQKKEIILNFTNGETIDFLSERFNCTKLTIIRNLKKELGEKKYAKLVQKGKLSKKTSIKKQINKNIHSTLTDETSNDFKTNLETDLINQINFSPDSSFVEIAPLEYNIDNENRKEYSSVSIAEINFPNTVYMIVDKKIELEIKLLKDYPEWHFLPTDDLNRKTLEIYYDLKIAKRFCTKDQKVLKIPNPEVFRIVSPILISKGISRIVSSDKLIAL